MLRWFGTNTDVSQQVEAERHVRESEERFREQFENANDFIFTADLEMRITSCNPSVAAALGYKPEELVGHSIAEFVPPEVLERNRAMLAAKIRGEQETTRYEVDVLGLDGTRMIWEINSRLIRSPAGEPTGLHAIARDVSARRHAETELRESEARLRALTNNLPGGMVYQVWTGPNGEGRKFLYVSQSHEKLTGVPAEAVLADASVAYELILPEDRDRLAQAEAAAIRDGGPFDVEARFRRADGVVRWCRIISGARDQEDGSTIWDGIQIDITGRRDAEARLRESEASLRLALQAGQLGEVTLHLDDERVTHSSAFATLLGYAADAQLTLAQVRKAYHPEDRSRVLKERAEFLEQGQDFFEVEHRVTWPDGQVRWVYGRGRVQRDDEGRPVALTAVYLDNTKRREAENTLRESEARFRLIADSAPVLMWVTRVDRTREFVNQAYVDFIKLPTEEASALDWRTILHPDDHDRIVAESVAGEASGERFALEARDRRGDGEWRWIRSISQPRRGPDGTLPGFIGVAYDRTEERNAQHALARRSDQLRGLADTAFSVVRISELNAMLDEINQAARRIIGSHCAVTSMTQGPDCAQAITAVALSDDYGHPREHGAMPDGYGSCAWVCEENKPARMTQAELEAHPHWRDLGTQSATHRPPVGLLAAPIVARDGRNLGVIQLSDKIDGSDFDAADEAMLVQLAQLASTVIEQSDAEVALRELNETLEERVMQRTSELEQAQEALRQSQKLEAMGQLTGGVAHDFNNLLTPIIGGLDMLQRAGIGGAREHRMLDGALQSAERAKTLVQRLLAFARRQPLQPSAVYLTSLVGGMAGLVASTSGPTIRVVVDVPADLPPAQADANQLEMAILNLSVNARDAMPDGGTLTISASAAEPAKQMKLKPGNYVRLSVADTGVGMDEATLARAIEPFFSTKGIGKGTGLGLSMVHGLASQLGGALTLSSKPGLGTNVELWLPVSKEAPEQEAAGQVQDAGKVGAGTALLVDDEGLVRASTADMLIELGFKVIEAESATEALAVLAEQQVDLVITDHLMPGITGTELAQTIGISRPNLPVLLISGYAQLEGISADIPRLTKPFRQADLAAGISEAMEKASVS